MVDCLANLSYNFNLGLCVFDYAPICIVSKLLDDLLAVPKSTSTPKGKGNARFVTIHMNSGSLAFFVSTQKGRVRAIPIHFN